MTKYLSWWGNFIGSAKRVFMWLLKYDFFSGSYVAYFSCEENWLACRNEVMTGIDLYVGYLHVVVVFGLEKNLY